MESSTSSLPPSPVGSPGTFRRARVIASGLLISGFVISAAIYVWMRQAERATSQAEFTRTRENTVRMFESRLRDYEETLHNLRSLFHTSNDVTRQEFATAAGELVERHPGLRALEWLPRVPAAKRAAFEAAVRAEGFPDFRLKERTTTAATPFRDVPDRSEYLPVLFIEPMRGNEAALGSNLATEPMFPVLREAAESDKIRSRGPVRLIERRDDTVFAYLAFLPVYEKRQPRAPASVQGYVMAVIRTNEVFSAIFGPKPSVQADIAVFDGENAGRHQLLHYSPADSVPVTFEKAPSRAELAATGAQETLVQGLGRTWEVWVRPSATLATAAAGSDAKIALGLNLLLSTLIAGYVHTLLSRARTIEQQVTQRTAELAQAQSELEDDIRRRTEAERALAASEERYKAFISHSNEAIWRAEAREPIPVALPVEEQIDRMLAQVYLAECNDAMARMYGYAEAREIEGAPLAAFYTPDNPQHRESLRAFITSGYRIVDVETHELDRHGRTRVFRNNLIGIAEDGSLRRAWGTQRDITDRHEIETEKRLIERRLLEGQKLESLGVLAGGIAHDFNNLLTGIVGHASLATLDLPDDAPAQGHLHQIEAGALRAAELCQQMLAYAGKGRFVVQKTDLNDLVQTTVPLLRASISKRAMLSFVSEAVPPVIADATQLRQIVMNLVVNASDAIGDHDGEIALTTGVVPRLDTPADALALAPVDASVPFVFFRVRDTGCGMTPETLAHIFDPFFTTKFAGRGLGLAAVLGIVRSHQGGLQVVSTPGAGTTFTLFIPATSGRAERGAASDSSAPWPRGGRALVIDDEEAVRLVAQGMLNALGIRSELAEDGLVGLERLGAPDASFDVVLLDLTMPRLSGAETLKRLRAAHPQLPVVLMSGYNRAAITDAGDLGFLQKPFTLEKLREQLRTALAQTTTRSHPDPV